MFWKIMGFSDVYSGKSWAFEMSVLECWPRFLTLFWKLAENRDPKGLANLANIACQTLLFLDLGVTFLPIANDSETNNGLCLAMLASFAKA